MLWNVESREFRHTNCFVNLIAFRTTRRWRTRDYALCNEHKFRLRSVTSEDEEFNHY